MSDRVWRNVWRFMRHPSSYVGLALLHLLSVVGMNYGMHGAWQEMDDSFSVSGGVGFTTDPWIGYGFPLLLEWRDGGSIV